MQASHGRPSQKRSLQDTRLPSFGSARQRKRSQAPQRGLQGNASGSQSTGQARRGDGPQANASGAKHAQETQQAQQAGQQQLPAQARDQGPGPQVLGGAATEQPGTADVTSGASGLQSKRGVAGQGSPRTPFEAQQPQQEAPQSVAAGLPPNPCETARVAEPTEPAGKGGAQASPFAKAAAEGGKEPHMVAADATGQVGGHTGFNRFSHLACGCALRS